MKKIVYVDGENTKVVRGLVEDEDDIFIHLTTDVGSVSINKTSVVSIKDEVRRV